jgi:hypothetical protein
MTPGHPCLFTAAATVDELRRAECVLATVSHVEEAVLILVLFVDCRHQRSSWRQCVLHKDKDGLFWAKLNPLPNHIDKLANSKISRDKVPTSEKKNKDVCIQEKVNISGFQFN